jgi:hypothetical protein
VAELKDEGLGHVELETGNPGTSRGVLRFSDKPGSLSAPNRALHCRDEVQEFRAASLVLGEINPPLHQGGQFATVE